MVLLARAFYFWPQRPAILLCIFKYTSIIRVCNPSLDWSHRYISLQNRRIFFINTFFVLFEGSAERESGDRLIIYFIRLDVFLLDFLSDKKKAIFKFDFKKV